MKKLLILMTLSMLVLSACSGGSQWRWEEGGPTEIARPDLPRLPHEPDPAPDSDESQDLQNDTSDEATYTSSPTMARRQMQTRYFDTVDKRMVMDSIMATMLDYGAMITFADYQLGVITCANWTSGEGGGIGTEGRFSVIASLTDDQRTRVRVVINTNNLGGQRTYIFFFDNLAKAMFLEAHLE